MIRIEFTFIIFQWAHTFSLLLSNTHALFIHPTKSINKQLKIIVISFGRLTDFKDWCVSFSRWVCRCFQERKKYCIITNVICSFPFFSTIYFRPSRPPPSFHLYKCMHPNQSANICILIMWLLRLNSHHKFHLYFAKNIFTLRMSCRI